MQRLRRALLRGRRADHWYYEAHVLVLRHPDGRNRDEVPIAHLRSDDAMQDHYTRLAGKDWVSRAAIAELREIAAGART